MLGRNQVTITDNRTMHVIAEIDNERKTYVNRVTYRMDC